MGEVKGKRKLSWWLIGLLGASVVFLLIVVGGVLCLGNELFREGPLPPEVVAVSQEDSSAIMKKVQPMIMKILQSAPGQVSELILTEGEFNAGVAMIANLQQMAVLLGASNTSWPKGFTLKFFQGRFYCNYSYAVDFRTPFGSYLNTHMVWEPEIRNGNIDFKISKCRVGSLDLKPEWVHGAVLAQLKKNPQISIEIKKVISDLYVASDGALVVRYFPYQFKLMMQEQMANARSQQAKQANDGDATGPN